MRSMHRWIEVCAGAVFFTAMLLRPEGGHAALQVVSDEACALHEIDIAAFATCESGRVTKPLEEESAHQVILADEDWRD